MKILCGFLFHVFCFVLFCFLCLVFSLECLDISLFFIVQGVICIFFIRHLASLSLLVPSEEITKFAA